MPASPAPSAPPEIHILTGLYQGEDRDLVFTVYQPGTTMAQIAAGTAVIQNVAGMNFEFAVKRRDSDSAQLISVVNGAQVLLASPTTLGTVTVRLLNANLSAALVGRNRYAFRRTDAGARSICALGDFVVAPSAAANS